MEMAGADRPVRAQRMIPIVRVASLPIGFILLHGLVIALGGAWTMPVSLIFLIAAPVMAGLICLCRGMRDGFEGWLPLAVAMACWAGGMTATMASIILLNITHEQNVSMLLYVLYGVPLIFMLASPSDERWPVRLIDALLAATLGYLFFRYVFAVTSLHGSDDQASIALRLMFDIENAYIALFAVLRLMACMDGRARQHFRCLAVFAGAYMLVAAYINHVESETDFGLWPDLLIDLPFLLLATMVLMPQHRSVPSVSRTLSLMVRAGSSLLLPATLLTIAMLMLSHVLWLAVAGFIVSALGYGLRSMLVQMYSYSEQDRLSSLTHMDALTGLPNRRRFDERLRQEAARAYQVKQPLSVLMIDIDHFKLLNDHLGHPIGDERLHAVAQALAGVLRDDVALVARYGGEEFVALLPAMEEEAAVSLAERMLESVEHLRLPSPAPHGIVTVSIGLAHGVPSTQTGQDLVDRADHALYQAKRNGRNRLSSHDRSPAMLYA